MNFFSIDEVARLVSHSTASTLRRPTDQQLRDSALRRDGADPTPNEILTGRILETLDPTKVPRGLWLMSADKASTIVCLESNGTVPPEGDARVFPRGHVATPADAQRRWRTIAFLSADQLNESIRAEQDLVIRVLIDQVNLSTPLDG